MKTNYLGNKLINDLKQKKGGLSYSEIARQSGVLRHNVASVFLGRKTNFCDVMKLLIWANLEPLNYFENGNKK
jgi:cyanate lyase